MRDEGSWLIGFGIALIVFGAIMMVIAIQKDNERYEFEKHCEQILDGHVEPGNLCVRDNKIIERMGVEIR